MKMTVLQNMDNSFPVLVLSWTNTINPSYWQTSSIFKYLQIRRGKSYCILIFLQIKVDSSATKRLFACVFTLLFNPL